MTDHYDLYYWPKIPGRGEFVRLALEAAGASYSDHCNEGQDVEELLALITKPRLGNSSSPAAFAPPILKHGDVWLSQTTNILLYLGPRLGLVPKDDIGRLHTNQMQLTISDLANEVHDVHHPVAVSLYYEDQKTESLRRSHDLRENRIPKFFKYFEKVLQDKWLLGSTMTYADLSLFQVIEGLYFAFPRLMSQRASTYPKIMGLHQSVKELPQLQTYLQQRLPFSDGLFRYYAELDSQD